MKKRMLSLFMCFVMCLSLCPTAAWAQDDAAHEHDHAAETSLSDQLSESFVEPEATPEPTAEPTPEAEPESEPESTPELESESEFTPEPTAEPESTPAAETESEPTPAPTAEPEEESAADEAVQTVQTLIDALPTADTVTAADYDAVQAAYDAYEALTPEQQMLITGAEIFEALFGWFNAQTEPLTGPDTVEIRSESDFADWLSKAGSNAILKEGFCANGESEVSGPEPDYALELNGIDLNQYAGSDYALLVNQTANLSLVNSGSTASTIYYVLHVRNGRTLTMRAENADVNVYSSILSTANGSVTAGNVVLAGKNGHKITLMGQFTDIEALQVSGNVTLQGGSYGSITVTDGGKVTDLLPAGYCFYEKENSRKLVKASGSTVSNVAVSACRHMDETGAWAFDSDYKCSVCGAACTHTDNLGGSSFEDNTCGRCGKTCAHETIGDDGVCTECGLSHVAKFTTSEGTTTYKTTLRNPSWLRGQTGTLTLLKDTDQAVDINSHSNDAPINITLDLNGKTIKNIVCGQYVTMTIRDGSAAQTGTIKKLAVENGDVTLESGTVGGEDSSHYLSVAETFGSTNVFQDTSTYTDSKLTVKGGKIVGSAGLIISGGTVSIQGGQISRLRSYSGANFACYLADDYALYQNYGTDSQTHVKYAEIPTGGVYNVTAAPCTHKDSAGNSILGADGKCPACAYGCTHEDADGNSTLSAGVCTLCGKTGYAAKVTTGTGESAQETKYLTVAAAYTALNGKTGTITLLSNTTETLELTREGDNITLDLGGKNIQAVKMDSESGKLTIRDTSESAGQITTLTVISGETTLASGKVETLYVSAGSAIQKDSDGVLSQDSTGKLIVTGGEVTDELCYAGAEGTVELRGGKFAWIEGRKSVPLKSFLAEGYAYHKYEDDGAVYDPKTAYRMGKVEVKAHTHSWNASTGACACGAVCPHEKIYVYYGYTAECIQCGMSMAAQVSGGGESSYVTSFAAALEKAAELKKSGAETVTVKLFSQQDAVANESDSTAAPLSLENVDILDLNGYTLNKDGDAEKGLTISRSITVKNGYLTGWLNVNVPSGVTATVNIEHCVIGKNSYGRGDYGGVLVDPAGSAAVNIESGSVNELEMNAGSVSLYDCDIGDSLMVNGGSLTVRGGLCGSLDIAAKKGSAQIRLHSGQYNSICCSAGEDEGWTLGDLLAADGYAFAGVDSGSSLYRSTKLDEYGSISRVKVIACSVHAIDENDGGNSCLYCGSLCGHNVLDEDGKCNSCGETIVAKVTWDDGLRYYTDLHLASVTAAEEEGRVITLLADVDETVDLVDGVYTLDLNGHTAKTLNFSYFELERVEESDEYAYYVYKGLTIRDGSAAKTGAVTTFYAREVTDGYSGDGTYVGLESGTIGTLNAEAYSEVLISGGTVTALSGAYNASITVDGGTVATLNTDCASVTVKSGTVGVLNTDALAEIFGGTVTALNTAGYTYIYDGTVGTLTAMGATVVISKGTVTTLNANSSESECPSSVRMGGGTVGTATITNSRINISRGEITKLDLHKAEATLSGGRYGTIQTDSKSETDTVFTLLQKEGGKSKWAFRKTDGDKSYIARSTAFNSDNPLTNVEVVCCPHVNMNTQTRMCPDCGYEVPILVTYIDGTDEKVKGYTLLKDALDFAAVQGDCVVTVYSGVVLDWEETVTIRDKNVTIAIQTGATVDLCDKLTLSGTSKLTIGGAVDESGELNGNLKHIGNIVLQDSAKLRLSSGGSYINGTDDSGDPVGDYTVGTGSDVTLASGNVRNQVNVTGGKLGVTGGRFDRGVTVTGGTVNVSGGRFNGKLTVGGGSVKLSGGTFPNGIDITSDTTYLELLADGCAYANIDSGAVLSAAGRGSLAGLVNIKVIAHSCSFTPENNGKCECGRFCPHENSDDDGNCVLCGENIYVAKVGTEKYRTLAAAAAAAADNKTVTLLQSVREDVTLSSGSITLDMADYGISGTVTVNTGAALTIATAPLTEGSEATLDKLRVNGGSVTLTQSRIDILEVVTGSLTTGTDGDVVRNICNQLIVRGGSVKLSGGQYRSVECPTEGGTIGALLNTGYGFKVIYDGDTKQWHDAKTTAGSLVSEPEATIQSITVKTLPIQSLTVTGETADNSYAYGKAATFTATANPAATETEKENYTWAIDSDDLWGNTNEITRSRLKVGSHTIRCSFTRDGYTCEATLTITAGRGKVSEADLSQLPQKIENLSYTGSAQNLVTTGSLLSSSPPSDDGYRIQYRLEGELWEESSGTSVPQTASPQGTKAGTYKVYWRVAPGVRGDSGLDSYVPTEPIVVEIDPATITPSISCAGKNYDGSTDAEVTVSFEGLVNGEELEVGTDYTVTAAYDSAGAGADKTVTATITLISDKAKNYQLSSTTATTTADITKAAAPVLTGITAEMVYTQSSITIDLSKITGMPEDAGNVTYSGDGVTGSTLTKTFDSLTEENIGDDFPVTVTVTSDNYADAMAGVSVTITDRAKKPLTVSMTGWTYGQTANEPQYTRPTDAAEATPVVTYKSTAEGAESTTKVPTDAGDYTVTVKLETAATVYSGSADFTIAKADIPDAAGYQAPKAKTGLSYTGAPQALFDDAVIPEGCELFYRVEGVTQESVWGDKASDTNLKGKNADTYTIHWFIRGNDNYNDYGDFNDLKELKTTIAPAALTPSITGASKVYDGTIDADEENITVAIEGLQNGETLTAGTDYTVTASYDSADAGTGKAVAAALSLMGDKAANYCFSDGETSAEVTTDEGVITKAPAPDTTPATLTVYNKLGKYYDFNFVPLLPTPEAGQTLGSVSWGLLTTSQVGGTKYYDNINYSKKTGSGSIQIVNINSETEGQVATMSVTVTSENFENFTLAIKVMAVNRKTLTGGPTLSVDEINYGDALRDITLSGTMTGPDGEAVEGTFAWDTPDTKPDAGTDVKANWSFTPNDTAYTEASGSASITVNKAAVPEDMFTAPEAKNLTYNKSAQELVAAGTSDTALGSILYSLDKTVDSWSTAVPQKTNAGSYTVYWYIPESTNYQSVGSAEQPREIAVSIAKADLTPGTDFYAPTANALTFNGAQQALVSADNVFTAENDELAGSYHVEYLQSSGDFGTDVPTGFDADTYSVSYRIEPDDADTANYNRYEAETPIRVTIAPLNLKTAYENSGDGSQIAATLNETLTFTGSAQTQTVTLKLKKAAADVVSDVCTLTANTDYTLAGNTQTNASTGYELSVTGAGNYTGSIKLSWSIAKADHSALSDVNVVRKYTRTDAQGVDVSALLNANAGNPTYAVASDLPQGVTAVMQEDGKTLSITITGKTADDVGGKITIPVTIGSDNYNDASVNVVVTITAKDVPTITPGTLTKTYDGKPLEASGKAMFENAEVAGQWSWKESSTTGGREVKKPIDVADSKTWVLVFTPDDAANYAAVETSVRVSIATRSIALKSADVAREYDGTELTNGERALTVTEGSMADGQSFTIAFTGSQTDIGRSDNSFEVSSSETADIGNYDIDTTFGELRVKLPADVGSKTRRLTKGNVTSDDREDVEETQTTVDAYLAMEPSSDENDNEKKTLEDLKKHVEELLQQLDDAKAAMQSETITKVDDIDKTNAKASDKPALEAAKAAIEKALEDFDGNYTEAEKTELNEKLARIKAALAALTAQEKAEKLAVRTGDEAMPVLWVLVLVVALAAVVVILIVRRKKK